MGASNVGSFGQLLLTLPGDISPFYYDEKYELSVSGLKDSADVNTQTTPYVFDFTVAVHETAIYDYGYGTSSHLFTTDYNNDGVLDTTNDGMAKVGGTTNALVNSPIYIDFDFKEALTGLNATSVVLTNDADGTAIPSTVVADADNSGVTVTPTADLAAGTAYKVIVKKSLVTDSAKNPLASDITLRFKTATRETVPKVSYSVTQYTPFDMPTLRQDGVIKLIFNGKVETAVAGTYILTDTTHAGTIPVKSVVSPDGKAVTLYPDTVLTAGDSYTIAVAGALTVDAVPLSTNVNANLTQEFTAGWETGYQANTGVETAEFNPTNKTLILTFDRIVDAASASLVTNYTINGGSLHIIGTSGVAKGNTVTFIVNTTTSVIVSGTTIIVAKKTALYTTTTQPKAFGTDFRPIN